MIKNAPIILVSSAEIANVTKYIKTNMASGGTVYILGGNNAVPATMEASLSGIKTKRLAGNNRYETNIAILKECKVKGQDIMVCSGNGFADSLSVSSVKKPILLVGSELTDNQMNYLKTLTTKRFYAIGGSSVISNDVRSEISKRGTLKKVEGSNRYATSKAVASTFFTGNRKNVVLVSGTNFPDGISAGPLANKLGAPILLVANGNYNQAKTFAKAAKCTKLYVMGGKSAISDSVVESVNS